MTRRTVEAIRRPGEIVSWCPVDVYPMRAEHAGPLGWIDRCPFDPAHWDYRPTSDPNTIAARLEVRS